MSLSSNDGVFNEDGLVYEGPAIERIIASKEFSAQVWATTFVGLQNRTPDMAHDPETMLCWFAGAIMTGFDRGRQEGLTHDHLAALCDALGEVREAGALDHWNADARRVLNDAHRALRCLEEQVRPEEAP